MVRPRRRGPDERSTAGRLSGAPSAAQRDGGGVFVQRLRRHVYAVRPRDRPGLDADLGEERRIGQRLENLAPLMFVEGDVANRAVPDG
jgi:hypothetical protein